MYKLRPYRQDMPFTDSVISADAESAIVNLGAVEGPFAMQISWENGSTVDMNIAIQLSNDKQNWVEIGSTVVNITGDSGSHMWDISSGAQFLRISVVVTTGSATFSANFNGKTR